MIAREKNRILIGGRILFPEGDPASARLLGMAKALQEAGYDPLVLSGVSAGREEDRQSDGAFRFRGVGYIPTGEIGAPGGSILTKLRRFTGIGVKVRRWLKANDTSNCLAFISAGGYADHYFRLYGLLRRRGVAYINDCVDWFGPGSLPGFISYVQSVNTELTMRVLNKRVRNIIGISSFFVKYYAERGCRVIRVPPLVDLEDPKWQPLPGTMNETGVLRLAYAGVPGKKDYLAPVLLSLRRARENGIRVHLNLIGPTTENVKQALGAEVAALDEIAECVTFHGRVPQGHVPKLLAESDFTVLLRPLERYSQAGFPTKVTESLAAGVPVISNCTSDIPEYVRDFEEGMLLNDRTVDDLTAAYAKLKDAGPAKWLAMRQAARNRAALSFDYRRYVEPLAKFLKNLAID